MCVRTTRDKQILGVGFMGLVPPTTGDILLLKQIRASTGILIFGYVFVLSGLLAILKSIFSSGEDIASQSADKEEKN